MHVLWSSVLTDLTDEEHIVDCDAYAYSDAYYTFIIQSAWIYIVWQALICKYLHTFCAFIKLT